MVFKEIKLDCNDGIASLVLNRPEKINALSECMVDEIIQACNMIAVMSDEVRVVLLSAAGEHFCAGHLLDEMINRDPVDYHRIFENCIIMMNKLKKLPQPIIGQVQGIATAAGCQMVAICDLVIVSQDARFATPGIRIGLFCSTPAVPLVRVIGRRRAMEMLLTGRWVSAIEAYGWGLVNRVVAVSDLAVEAKKLALQIAAASPLTLAIGKKTFYNQLEWLESEAFKIAAANMALNLCMYDAQEGIKSFLEKRKPVWKGR